MNLLGSMIQGGYGMMERGWCWSVMGKLDDGHAFERDYCIWYCISLLDQ